MNTAKIRWQIKQQSLAQRVKGKLSIKAAPCSSGTKEYVHCSSHSDLKLSETKRQLEYPAGDTKRTLKLNLEVIDCQLLLQCKIYYESL